MHLLRLFWIVAIQQPVLCFAHLGRNYFSQFFLHFPSLPLTYTFCLSDFFFLYNNLSVYFQFVYIILPFLLWLQDLLSIYIVFFSSVNCENEDVNRSFIIDLYRSSIESVTNVLCLTTRPGVAHKTYVTLTIGRFEKQTSTRLFKRPGIQSLGFKVKSASEGDTYFVWKCFYFNSKREVKHFTKKLY